MDIDTGTEDLLLDVSDGVATLTLNRPERKNAISQTVLNALGPAIKRVEESPAVGAIVLTATGNVFCAGGDIKDFKQQGGEGGGAATVDPHAVRLQQTQQREIIGRLRQLSKPVLASLPGPAAGAGIGYALAADLRIGTPRTVMASAFIGVALSGDFGTSWQLQELVGRARTAQIMMLGERLTAATCLELGLLNWVVEPEQLEESTAQFARKLADGPRLALRHVKANLNTAGNADLLTAMDREVERHKECGVAPDHIEAVTALLERRTPDFAAIRRRNASSVG